MDWIKYLKTSVRDDDKKIFQMWVMDEINLEQCLMLFRKHNKIPQKVNIDIMEFAKWLNELGWIKYEIDS